MKKQKNVSDFPALMVSACEAAIAAKVFYESEFQEFVFKYMGGTLCKPVLVDVVSFNPGVENYRAGVKEVEEKIKQAPRGHYAIIERLGDSSSQSSYSVVVSDGSGELATGGKYDVYDVAPCGEDVMKRMVSYEIYLCRKAVENRNSELLNQKLMAEHGFHIGQRFKNLPSDQAFPTHIFSTSTIMEVLQGGQLKMQHTKRGTSNVWEGIVPVQLLVKMIEWSKPKAETVELSPGQIAYEAELKVSPTYADGSPRKTWNQLDAIAKQSWEKNPTPRYQTASLI